MRVLINTLCAEGPRTGVGVYTSELVRSTIAISAASSAAPATIRRLAVDSSAVAIRRYGIFSRSSTA